MPGASTAASSPPTCRRRKAISSTLFLSLRDTPPEALTRFAAAVGWALRVLQAEKAPLAEMERVLKEAMAGPEG